MGPPVDPVRFTAGFVALPTAEATDFACVTVLTGEGIAIME